MKAKTDGKRLFEAALRNDRAVMLEEMPKEVVLVPTELPNLACVAYGFALVLDEVMGKGDVDPTTRAGIDALKYVLAPLAVAECDEMVGKADG